MHGLRHLLALGAALVVGGVTIVGTAHAQTPGYYAAVPAQAPTKASLITRETLWKLRGTTYVADRAPDRDTTLCAAVAKSAGALTSFTVAGKAYDADQLAKCNGHAKGGLGGAAVAQAR